MQINKFIFILISILTLIGFFFATLYLFSAGFKIESTLRGDNEVIQSVSTNEGLIALYQNNDYNSFGIAEIKKVGPLYVLIDQTVDNSNKDNNPFTSLGYDSAKHGFSVAVKVSKTHMIKYITVGDSETLDGKAHEEITLNSLMADPNTFKSVEVIDDFALILTNEYSEENWTIRAFDSDGNLVAQKLFGSQVESVKE